MKYSKLWVTWGKAKQVLTQLGIYFSVISMGGIAVTTWHTTISPILESHGITPSYWWLLALLGIPLLVLGVFEWRQGTLGFIQSFTQMFYSNDSQMRKDIEELKKGLKELNEKLGEEYKKE